MGGGKWFVKFCGCCYGEKYTVNRPKPGVNDTIAKLNVTGVDLCHDKNGEEHHTQKFELMRRSNRCLVVRRGQAFHLTASLTRPFDVKADELTFILRSTDKSGEEIKIPLTKDGAEDKKWTAVYKSQSESDVTVAVTAPADCAVGTWTMVIIGDQGYTHPQPIYILFNPWCEKDTVYMPDDALRKECVEEDSGLIYRGVPKVIKPSPWCFAQFHKDVLDCTLYLVKSIGKVESKARGDPIVTVRALSAAVNFNDDYGILWGRWASDDKDYAGGKKPWEWVGSLEIIQQYYKTKSAVKFAQCWVFAGVLTTVCRALGIPCRPVTCFSSAHDYDSSLTIDKIINESGKNESRDMVWNYHVWNEVWLDRPDLEAGYGGWQIIDATPQEESNNKYQCGPAPLKAIYDGRIEMKYDVPFVFAEVNADMLTWKKSGSELELLSVDSTSAVGQNISTKAAGSWAREDLTDRYKSPEGSNREREIVEKALKKSKNRNAHYYRNKAFADVKFDVVLPKNAIIGQNFEVGLIMKNESKVPRLVTGNINVKTETYRGRGGAYVLQEPVEVNLKPEETVIVTRLVTFDEYYKKLVDQGSFKITCMANISEVDYTYHKDEKFRLRNPDVKMQYDGSVLHLELANPLPIPLTGGRFQLQAAELDLQTEIKLNEIVSPQSTVRRKVEFPKPRFSRCHVVAKFISNELNDVDGFLTI